MFSLAASCFALLLLRQHSFGGSFLLSSSDSQSEIMRKDVPVNLSALVCVRGKVALASCTKGRDDDAKAVAIVPVIAASAAASVTALKESAKILLLLLPSWLLLQEMKLSGERVSSQRRGRQQRQSGGILTVS